jgi:hypothetical protein
VIGGKVLDPSALAAQAQGSIAMPTWLAVTVPTGLVLYLVGAGYSAAPLTWGDASPVRLA